MRPLSFEERLLNMNEKSRRVDNFYVTFYGLPENIANILGRQVKSITRPSINYNTDTNRYRGNTYKNLQNLTFDPVTLVFYDDENSIVGNIMYLQLFRQQNKYSDKFGELGIERDYRFDVKIEQYNARDQLTESYVIKDCFLQAIDHSDPNMTDQQESEIIVTLEYDNLDILIFDEYVSMNGG